jgi:tetratricopeptide (TPR) repeat protein
MHSMMDMSIVDCRLSIVDSGLSIVKAREHSPGRHPQSAIDNPQSTGCYNSAVLSEIQRGDARIGGDHDAAADADRDAKIEQLLLVGLDHYFAARYEQAINVWTRALFLDRNHPRARAYIERARSALAERQRQSEELLHDGVAAFQRGEGGEARRLLQAAIDGGAPSDEALAVLDRLNRLEVPAAAGAGDASSRTARAARQRGADRESSRWPSLVWAGGAVMLAAAATAAYAWSSGRFVLPGGSLFREPAPTGTAAPLVQDLSLPLPRRGELALTRARALAAGGRLHDALTALDQVRPTDAQKGDADRLRADIQRQLLALTPMPAAPADRRLP